MWTEFSSSSGGAGNYIWPVFFVEKKVNLVIISKVDPFVKRKMKVFKKKLRFSILLSTN